MKAAVRIANPGPIRPDRQVRRRARDRTPGRCHDPEAAGEQDGEDDDPARVEDRREGVEEELAVRNEHLAERDRCREQDLGEAVDAQQLDVQVLGRRVEAVTDDARQPRRDEEQEDARDGHQADRSGQHGAPELVGGAVIAVVVAETAVDRHERRRQAGSHQDVEGDLRDAERRVVGVELGAGAVRVGEDAVAHDAGREVGERQDRQEDRAAREDAVEQAAGRRDGGRHEIRASR